MEKATAVRLPVTDQDGYYEIRLESIGGLGANLCGSMLGELGSSELGLNSTSFSSYGSEKTGTPVKAYIRYCEKEKEIRVHSPVTHPHILGIFHEALLSDPAVFEGCMLDTDIIINTEHSPQEIAALAQVSAKVYGVPAQKIAMETHSRINVVMFGAIAKIMGFVPLEAVKRICEHALGRKYPHALPANLEGLSRGYREVWTEAVCLEKTTVQAVKRDLPEWGYATAPDGGINPQYGNSICTDVSPSRQGFAPVFLPERCIHCGLCDSTCPDMVFQFVPGEYRGKQMMINRGLDYYHCKGCLRCVEICPVHALIAEKEADHPDKQWFLPNQDLLRTPSYYRESGPDGYITSESYLTEKRMEGGEV